MNLPHNKFCVLPWISIEASPIGTVRPCCLADDEIIDNDGNKFELATAKFDDIQNSDHMRKLRQQFLDGEKPQTCRKCWNEERSDRTSKRMHTLDRLKHMLPDQDWTADAKPLMFLDLKLGNICNLKCRICGSWSSSQFAAEELNDIKLYISRYKDTIDNTNFFTGSIKEYKVVSCFAEDFYEELHSRMIKNFGADIAIIVILTERRIIFKKNNISTNFFKRNI
jgi:MoaA/NifB/PqqE/SkfB family radical SAM enzyme